MDLISVIIPVYNVEKYLDKCVESVVNQTYKNLEIILVDDGSPDNCGKMCDAWAEKDSRVKVIHKQNGGLSDARNAGIEESHGNLIGFVDSDDYISYNMYEELYDNLTKNESDISACGVELFWEDSSERKGYTCDGEYVFTAEEAIRENIYGKKLPDIVWNKLYKKDVITDVWFKVGKLNEDVSWTYLVLAKTKKVSVFDKKLYYYFQNSKSIMGKPYSTRRFDIFDALLEKYNFIKKNYPQYAYLALQYYCGTLRYHFQYISRLGSFDADKKYRKLIFGKFCDAYCRDLYRENSFINNVWLFLFKINPYFCVWVRNKLKIGL